LRAIILQIVNRGSDLDELSKIADSACKKEVSKNT
jgi:hypothetical protein